MAELINGAARQGRVISALMLREIGGRHGGGNAGILWLLLEPIFMTLIVIGIHEFSGANIIKSVPVVVFLLTGYVPHLMFRHGGLSGVSALTRNGGLLYHRQVHYVDIVLARWAVEAITVLGAFALIYFGFYVFGQITLPYSMAFLYLGWFFHIWFAMIGCFLFTGLGIVFPLVRRIFMPLSLLMLPVYAAFFMLSWLTAPFRNFLLYFPTANATEMMRFGYFGPSQQTYFDIPYTIEVLLVLTVISILVMDWGRKRLEV